MTSPSTVSRRTSRTIDLSDFDLGGLTLPAAYSGGARFLPYTLTETVEDITRGNNPDEAVTTSSYVVEVRGPRLTKSGKTHATQRGEARWVRNLVGSYSTLAQIPEEVQRSLFGAEIPEELQRFLFGAEILRYAEPERPSRT